MSYFVGGKTVKINQTIKKWKQRYRPVKRVKKTLSKKKNQRRLILGAGALVIITLAVFLVQGINRQNELQERILQNQAVIEKTQKDVEGLKHDVGEKQKTLEANAKTIEEKNQKQAELEKKIEELIKLNHELKSYGSGIGGGRVAASSNVHATEGNAYGYGYCTWYVKNKRPDIGSYWGNANQWYASAQAAGYATGSEPRAGAIGVSFVGSAGHVVYVESVSGGTVNISEMNGAAGWNVVGTRSTSASEFVYIYGKS